MRAINNRLGRNLTNFLGLLFIVASSALFWFLVQLKSNERTTIVLILACILLGIGTSTTNICSFSLTSDLIGLNTECGAFVYGIMSFMDKLANGIVIALIQQFNPCSVGTTSAVCASYYRHVLTFIPIGVSLLMFLSILSLWRTTLGANRHEIISENPATSYGT